MPEIFKKRKTISAKEIGVTLTISDKALKKIEEIKRENIKNMINSKPIIFD